jgi:alkanesulfonate monooxygenase SsuD/methylene tetrahydromethanopterin reductase-like flavin-dependent oxidoreductase (luciferase family)
MPTAEFHLFLPQMRMTMPDLVERARAAEAAGFTGMALMDHFAPPLAEEHGMWEAMTTAGWLLASTSTLTLSHLVLCDTFRHPAMLARQAVSLDHASGGRFELGIGSGSVPAELDTFGLPTGGAGDRITRLGESLAIMRALWRGETVDTDGAHFRMQGAQQMPPPLGEIPIVIGGTGPRTMRLVAEHADWWNLPLHQLDRLDDLRADAGRARVSVQLLVTLVHDEAERAATVELADRRFGFMPRASRAIGSPAEVAEAIAGFGDRGVERVYTWFTDFAEPRSLARFGADVIGSVPA